jgi:hypothetical protein
MIPLDYPFKYDGKSNVIVEIQYSGGSPNTYNYFEAGSNTNIHRMWANSPTATTGSVGSNYGLCTKFVGGVGGDILNDVVFSSATAYNNGAKLLMDNDDNLYCVYTDREGTNPSQISISNSSDLGESWFQNPVTKATTRQLEPSVAIDSKDVLHVVWRGLVSSNYQIHYANSANGGVTWGNSKTITSTSANNYAPSIAIDSNDKAHIVWNGGSGSKIYYTSRTSTGTWGTISTVDSNIGDHPAIAVDSSDNVHIVWGGKTSSTSASNVYYRKLSSSSTWGTTKALTSSTSNDNAHPSIAIDRSDNIHVMWDAEPSPNAIMHMKWDDSTSSWSSAEIVSTNTSANNRNPSVGVDHRGYIYVFWYKTNPYMIMMSMFDDRYWTGDLEVSSLRELNKTTWHPSVLSSGGRLPARGSAVVFTADNGTADNVYFMTTRDLNLTDFGPWKGIPKMKHLYRDDNPSKSETNVYTVRVKVRDDDTGIGSWTMSFEVRNVWPEIIEREWVAEPTGLESMFYTPEIKFRDPGSGPTENWTMWLDMDNSENWTAGDHFFNSPGLYDVEMINDVSYVTIRPQLLHYNDDCNGTFGVYIYDDDIPDKKMLWNVTWTVSLGKILLVNQSTTASAAEKVFFDWFETQAKKENWLYEYKPWSTSINFSKYSLVLLADTVTSSFYRSYSKTIKSKIIDQNISLYAYGYGAWMLMDQLSLGQDARHGYGGFRYNYMIGNYAGITTGYTGTVYLTSSGSASGRTIERYSNFNGQELFSVYSGDQTEVCFGVYDRFNSTHTYNGATGDRNSGRVAGKVAFYSQTFTGSPTFNLAWDVMMNRTIKWLLQGAPNQGVVETHEVEGYKGWMDYKVENAMPVINAPSKVYYLSGEPLDLEIELSDPGSDDLYFELDWGDNSSLVTKKWYNNGVSPEPIYPPTSSEYYGIAPFEQSLKLQHTYTELKNYYINITVWDDDLRTTSSDGTEWMIIVEPMSPKTLKETVVKELEKLLPGRMGWLGYESLALKYSGEDVPYIMVYNHINRAPFYWETKLLVTFCDVSTNDTLFIDGSNLADGMLGTSIFLKAYNESLVLLDETEIDTLYTCLEPIKIGQKYGPYEVMNFTKLEGLTYHHYSKYAQRTEDALDHVLRSLNRDPRRGYGWWHQAWVWWCGYTFYRDFWIGEERLDPQYGTAVFCEERAAVTALMEVIKNCMDPQAVKDITFNYTGTGEVDVEVYTLSEWFMGGWWSWFDGFYNLKPGDSFKVDGSTLSGGVLTDRIMMRVYNAKTGKLLETIYIRSSGEWFLEVEPGCQYGDLEILASTIILGNNTEWDEWWGGDVLWWDWFFGFWYWEHSPIYNSRCGWVPEECYDSEAAKEEQERICSNVTKLKQLINMLVIADQILAKVAIEDAEDTTVMNSSYADEYMYHLSWAKRYNARGDSNSEKGRAYEAITDYMRAWRYSVLAMKWAIKNPEDTTDPADEISDPCGCVDCDDFHEQLEYPWWMHWYINWCNWGHLKKGENPSFPCESC